MAAPKLETHKGAFIEIVRVSNGYAVYDFSIASHQAGLEGRRPMPIAVFETKDALVGWLVAGWQDEVYEPLMR